MKNRMKLLLAIPFFFSIHTFAGDEVDGSPLWKVSYKAHLADLGITDKDLDAGVAFMKTMELGNSGSCAGHKYDGGKYAGMMPYGGANIHNAEEYKAQWANLSATDKSIDNWITYNQKSDQSICLEDLKTSGFKSGEWLEDILGRPDEKAYAAAKLATDLTSGDPNVLVFGTPTHAAIAAFSAASDGMGFLDSAEKLTTGLVKVGSNDWRILGSPEYAAVATFSAAEKSANDATRKIFPADAILDWNNDASISKYMLHAEDPVTMEELFGGGTDDPLALMDERNELRKLVIEINPE